MGAEIETTKEMSENVFSRESNPGLLVTGQMPYHLPEPFSKKETASSFFFLLGYAFCIHTYIHTFIPRPQGAFQ